MIPRADQKGWKAKRKKQGSPERSLHKLVADYLDLALPGDAFWFPIPNGTFIASPIYRAMLARTKQIKAGVPDLGIVYRRPIFIELKDKYRDLSEEQERVHVLLTGAGAVVAICRSLPEVKAFLSQLIPLKEVRVQ